MTCLIGGGLLGIITSPTFTWVAIIMETVLMAILLIVVVISCAMRQRLELEHAWRLELERDLRERVRELERDR